MTRLVAVAVAVSLAISPARAEERQPVIWVENGVVYAAWGEAEGARPDRRAALVDSAGAVVDTFVVLWTSGAVSGLWGGPGRVPAREPRWIAPVAGLGLPPRGRLTVAIGALPTTLDPAFATSLADKQVATQIFEGLVRLNARLEPEPGLATFERASATSHAFRLRPDARFHDGRRVRASDVKASLERALSPALRAPRVEGLARAIAGGRDFHAGRASALTGVVIVDSLTLEIEAATERAPLLAELASPAAFVVPVERAGASAADARFARAPVGSGPFRFARADSGGVLLVAAPGRGGGPDTLEFRYERSPQAAALDFQLGRLDVVSASSADAPELAASGRADPEPLRQLEASTYYLAFDTRKPFLAQRDRRQALAGALDRALAVKVLVPDRGVLAERLVPPVLRPQGTVASWQQGREAAQARVRAFAAGAPELQFWLPAGSPTGVRLAEFVAAEYRRLGLRVKIVEQPWAEFERGLVDGQADLFYLSWFADGPDPIEFVASLVESTRRGKGGNRTHYSNPEVDKALDAARTAPNVAASAAALAEAEWRALSEAPLVPLFHSVNVTYVRSGISRLALDPLGASRYDVVEVAPWH